jgi:hypothetical protein
MQFSDFEEDFLFEKKYCYDHPEVFLNEAISLKYCVEVLTHFESLKVRSSFGDSTGIEIFPVELTQLSVFPFRSIRMLMAYSLENAIKYQIILHEKRIHKDVETLDLGLIKGHDLVTLLAKIELVLDESLKLYLDTWSKCSIWAGRYPIAIKALDMYKSRRTFETPTGELMGSIRIAFGFSDRITESDLIHTNIGDFEFSKFLELFELIQGM